MSLFLVIFSALKYTDTSTVTPAFLSLMFPWYIFFHLFIFYLLISLYLKWFYCYQHIVGSYFLMQYVSLHCLTGIFRLFKFVYYWWDLALACHFVFICFFYFFFFFVCLFVSLFSSQVLLWVTWTYFRIQFWYTYSILVCLFIYISDGCVCV